MIFGSKEKLALVMNPISYIDGMSDFDCLCGFFINNKGYISDVPVMFNVQRQSVIEGALNHIVDNSDYYYMSLDDCFKSLLLYRYLNFIAESEDEYNDKDWVDYEYNEFIYSANLESSIYGENVYDIFCVGNSEMVRLISYKIFPDYYSLNNLEKYNLNECFIEKKELKKIIEQVENRMLT
ncbi:hypothetical protein KTH05_07105 [Acinetobacter lactucae]|uniref:hypothetical protein n=1 Tax=Acinetobacter lactucae TaxID=1785128 RepID=UPI0021CD35EB|nr:hypothetical protein [Acinetobacter lactucae]MCU4347514.1 hypothetical protein [Acinetobacter lactucae]